MIAHGSVVLLVMTDGRADCIERAIPSAEAALRGRITRRVVHDDSGDETYRAWLHERFPDYELIWHPAGRQGFGGAYRSAWRFLTGACESFVFSTEDDFVFNRPVRLTPMMELLDALPYLAQLTLRRQPWNADEIAAGGIVEQHPDAYADHSCCVDHAWLEHRLFFSTNPSLYRRSLCAKGWPDVEHSEGVFTHQLLEDPDLRFGFWGARDSGEAVTHIGNERVGSGY